MAKDVVDFFKFFMSPGSVQLSNTLHRRTHNLLLASARFARRYAKIREYIKKQKNINHLQMPLYHYDF